MNTKIRPARLSIFLLMFVPLVLAACGASGKDNSENFLKAIEDRDRGKAKDAACDDVHDEIDVLFDLASESDEAADINFENLECEEDGDEVTCTEGEDAEIVFEIEDGKVCGGELFDQIRALDDASAEESGQNALPTLAPTRSAPTIAPTPSE